DGDVGAYLLVPQGDGLHRRAGVQATIVERQGHLRGSGGVAGRVPHAPDEGNAGQQRAGKGTASDKTRKVTAHGCPPHMSQTAVNIGIESSLISSPSILTSSRYPAGGYPDELRTRDLTPSGRSGQCPAQSSAGRRRTARSWGCRP